MLKEEDIKLHTYYGVNSRTSSRVMAYTWDDGPEGVNYTIEGVMTILPMFCSKAEFLARANQQI